MTACGRERTVESTTHQSLSKLQAYLAPNLHACLITGHFIGGV
jgi:hypothetical protein